MNGYDGGCAYPAEYYERSGMHGTRKVVSKGMTLRDYFAGQFMSNGAAAGDWATLAGSAYEYADAMLEARK